MLAYAVSPYGTHTILATDPANPTRTGVDFDAPLSTSDTWTITATTVKAPYNNQWGSWILHALTTASSYDDRKLEFYDNTISNGSDIKLNGSTLLPETGNIPLETPIKITLISNGSGSILASVEVEGRTGTRIVSNVTDIYSVYAGYQRDVNVEIRNTVDPIIYASPSLSFAYVFTGKVNSLNFPVFVAGLNSSYQLTGADASFFTLTEQSDYTAATGGTLKFDFAPTEARTYNAQLEISASGAQTVIIQITGNGVLFPVTSLSETPDPSDKWYYIFNLRRMPFIQGGHVFADNNSGKLVQTKVIANTPDDSQLWKVIKQDDDKYVFINKATGNKIDASGSGDVAVAATTPSTFKFVIGTGWNAGYSVIYNNEKSLSINKGASNNTYTLYGNPLADDLGNSVAFVEEGQEDFILNFYNLLFSTDDDEKWYRIQFQRRGTSQSVEDVGLNANIKCGVAKAETTAQYWKFTGAIDDLKIESYAGYEMASNGVNKYVSKNKGDGNSFKIENHTTNGNLALIQLYNNTTTCNGSYRYVNSENSGAYEITGYSVNDGGNWFYFIPVSPAPEFTVESATLDFDIVANETTKDLSFAVNTRNLTGTVDYVITGANASYFTVDQAASVWSNKRGGTLNIVFAPTSAVVNYTATLEITANGETKSVALTGTGTGDPFITLTSSTVDFGNITAGLISEKKTTSISISYAQGDIAYTQTGADSNYFEIDDTQFDPATGGILGVTFKPTEARTYSDTIEINSLNAETKKIVLTGVGEATELPVTLSEAGKDVWYYIQFFKRGGNIIQDMGETKALETRPAIEGEDAQLWKVVSTGVSGKYRIISKTGNEIVYTAAAQGDIAADRFYTTATANTTYRFDKRDDGSWQIYCNEISSYINKVALGSYLQNTQICKYHVIPDDGSSIAFIPEEDIEFNLPKFSTSTENNWYRIQFLRRSPSSVTTTGVNKVVTDSGLDANLTQTDLDENNINQYWKLVGTWDNFKLVSVNGYEFGYVTDKYNALESGTGNEFALAWNKNVYDAWRIYNKTTGKIVDDQGGATVTDYAEYANDGGNALQFIPVESFIDFVIDVNEIKTATSYNKDIYGDIVFKSDNTSTGQLTGIENGGLEVNGKVKLVKTFEAGTKYALGFPFGLSETTPADAYELKSYNGTTNLYEAATSFEVNKGYLLSCTEETEITFVSTDNPTLYNTAAAVSALAQGYTFIANPFVANTDAIDEAERYYICSVSNLTPYDYLDSYFVLLAEDATPLIKPFEAVIVTKGVTNLYTSIGTGNVGISAIDSSDPVILVKYYSLQGVEIQKPTVNGIYLVKNIHASQREETRKELVIIR
jgi:hypothetical protein